METLGYEYGKCLVSVENNASGWSVLQDLIEKKYPNILYMKKGTEDIIDAVDAEFDDSCIAGFTTTSRTRPIIISKFDEVIRNKELILKSERIYDEMRHFAWIKGKPQAQKGKNDDLIMAISIAVWIREKIFENIKKNIAYKKAILDSITVKKNSIQTSVIGMRGYDIKKDYIQKSVYEQYKWLYVK